MSVGAQPASISADVLNIDAERVVESITDRLRSIVRQELRRQGAVVGVSGGIDSSVTAALCARAFGSGRTLAVLMPEADSDDETLALSRLVTEAFEIEA